MKTSTSIVTPTRASARPVFRSVLLFGVLLGILTSCDDEGTTETGTDDASRARDTSTSDSNADTADSSADIGADVVADTNTTDTGNDTAVDDPDAIADQISDDAVPDLGSDGSDVEDSEDTDDSDNSNDTSDTGPDVPLGCSEDTTGSTSGLVSLGSNGLLEIGEQYDDIALCDPFLIDYFKFTPDASGAHVITVSHPPIGETECFLLGLLTDPEDTNTLFDADDVVFEDEVTDFTFTVTMDTLYYMTVLKLSPCSVEGDLIEAPDYGLFIAAPQ